MIYELATTLTCGKITEMTNIINVPTRLKLNFAQIEKIFILECQIKKNNNDLDYVKIFKSLKFYGCIQTPGFTTN